jgi:hypothetical protein
VREKELFYDDRIGGRGEKEEGGGGSELREVAEWSMLQQGERR